MEPGRRIAGRFELARAAGAGGMATVYRALDHATGAPVAVKILREVGPRALARFAREARVLAEIRHPGVVRLVASGTLDAGEPGGGAPGAPYLVLEWLEGEDLGATLAQRGLTIDQSVALARQAAAALAVVHEHGVVHRDVKPSNLFLVGGRIDDVKLLDFGIARDDGPEGLTRTGYIVGTPGYMAPEQARGAREIDARADLFSLGCVLFQCLTGCAAFEGAHVMAVLAKVLLDDAPPVRAIRPEVPPALDALVARLLDKDPAARPPDAAAVVAALEALGDLGPGSTAPRPPAAPSPPAITDTEMRLASVLIVRSADAGAEVPLRALAAEHDARFERLLEGTLVLTLLGAGAATDQAARAARCALAVRAALPTSPAVLATGRATVNGARPMGEAIDRAAQMLWLAEQGATTGAGPAPVWLDALTAGLLDARFEVVPDGGALLLRGAREAAEPGRTLLGKRITCIGRDRELAMLEALFEECASEPAPRAVVIKAPAGVGKSRLRHELERRLRAAFPDVEVWIARGDPMRAGAPLGMLGQVVRRAADLRDGEPCEARRDKLRGRVARHVDAPNRLRVAEFLGEIVGTPFPEDERVQLQAARRDPQLLGDQMRRAWIDFVEAECRAHPVVLVLEDVHWGDGPTMAYVDAALRVLGGAPLFVLALARPEVDALFPALFGDRHVTQVRLPELSRAACAALVRQVLGEDAAPDLAARLWERSGGNAFFLEELLRARAEGRGDAPETVLAMVQSRLEALEPELRRVLRAGSVFGRVFWRGAALALLGAGRTTDLDARLQELERRELVVEVPAARFQGEREYAFRHALVREAAYGMLPDEDRMLGHALAAAWLGEAGEHDAMVVAEHYDRGDDAPHAIAWYRRAAEQALEANDLAGAIARAARAEARGAAGEALGEVALVRAEAHGWRGETDEAERFAKAALRELPRGGARWYVAAREVIAAAGKLGHNDVVARLGEVLCDELSTPDASGSLVIAAARGSLSLFNAGAYDLAWALHRGVEAHAERFRDDAPVAAVVAWARAARALFAGDAARFKAQHEIATAWDEQAGNLRSACNQRVNTGYACNELGAWEEAAAVLRAALSDAERMGLATVVLAAKHNLGLSLARLGALDEARDVEEDAVARAAAAGALRMEGGSRVYLATILELQGDLAGAEAEARRAGTQLEAVPPMLAVALARLAAILMAAGRAPEALEPARRGADLLAALGVVEEGESLIRLVWAEALAANGDLEGARAAGGAAQERLLERAGKITDPALRASFLERVPEHRRTLERWASWGAGGREA